MHGSGRGRALGAGGRSAPERCSAGIERPCGTARNREPLADGRGLDDHRAAPSPLAQGIERPCARARPGARRGPGPRPRSWAAWPSARPELGGMLAALDVAQVLDDGPGPWRSRCSAGSPRAARRWPALPGGQNLVRNSREIPGAWSTRGVSSVLSVHPWIGTGPRPRSWRRGRAGAGARSRLAGRARARARRCAAVCPGAARRASSRSIAAPSPMARSSPRCSTMASASSWAPCIEPERAGVPLALLGGHRAASLPGRPTSTVGVIASTYGRSPVSSLSRRRPHRRWSGRINR
jgi:hypothetical protein